MFLVCEFLLSSKISWGPLASFAPWWLELLRRSNREGTKSTKDTRRDRASDDLFAA